MSDKMIQVLITDHHRGVYYARIAKDAITEDPMFAHDVRHVRYWVADEGIGELCTKGPQQGSEIGPPVTLGLIRDVKNVLSVSDEAAKALAQRGWKT